MGEIKNPENSGVSDPSGDEQIDEEGEDSESFEGNSITDAISQDEADNSEGNADANAAEEPAGDAEESILEMEESEELPALKSSPDSMETAPDLKVTFAQVVLGEDGKASSYADLGDAAEITFMNNSVDSDGTVIKDAEVENITFKVTPKTGTKVTAVQYATAETEDDFTFEKTAPSALKSAGTVTGDPNTEYKISEKIADLSAESNTKKQIRIFITTQTVEYKVSFAPGVYLPDDKGAYNFSGSTASTATVNYGGSLKFAVTGTEAAKTKAAAVKKDSTNDTFTLTGTEHAAVTEPATPKYVEYTLDPANVNGLESTMDDEITVTVADIPAVKITVAADGIVTGTDVTMTAPTAEGYKPLAAGSFDVSEKLIFNTELAKDSKYKLLAPVAYWTTATVTEQTDDNTLEVKTEKVTIGTEEKECYVIDLSGITENANLHVVLGSELDTEKPDVKTVAFETAEPEDAEHVKVVDQATSNKDLLSGGDKTTANEYSFVVKPEDGYRVTEVRVSGTKTYTDKENPATAPLDMVIKNDGTEFDEKKDDYFYPFNDDQEMKVLFGGTDPAAEGDEEAKDRNWTVSNVTVTVSTEIQATLTDVDVVFDSKSAASLAYGGYQIEVDPQDGKVAEKEGREDTNTYTVKEGTPYLQFTVKDAETAPVVKVNDEEKLAERVEGSGFTYRVPAISLEKDENKIEILRKSKQVFVDYNDANSIELKVYDVQDADDEDDDKRITMTSGKGDENYDVKETGTVNVDAEILIKGKLADAFKSQITEVTFKVGDGAAQPAKLTGNSFEIQTKASEDITVYVNKDTDKVLEVKADGSLAELVGDDVYAVGYADTVTAQIFEKETAVDLFSAVVKDGATNAASKATISQDNKTATIKISKSERNKPLTVTLTTLKDRTQMTFTIRSNNPVASVTYDAIKDGKVDLQVDTAITTGVTLTGENVQKISNLDWGFVAADAQDAKLATQDNDYVDVVLDEDDNLLTITARPSLKDGVGGKTARIVLYDSANPEKIIDGSSIVVTTLDSAILGKAPTVGTIESTAKTLRVPITSPAEVGLGEELVEGKLMYKIDVKGPSSVTGDLGTAITAALSQLTGENAYYDKAEVDADGGVSLKVIADSITNANGVVSIAGGAADFTVDVTLVQIIDKESGYEDSNIIVGGSDTGKTATTKAPAYENTKQKLNLQKGTTTITTGDEHWVTIAKPKFDEKVGYASVDVAFVDTKTGLLKNVGDPDEFSGLDVWYNDMTQAVEVRSNLSEDHNWYEENKDGEYKNLGVKVTAVTKDTGYGISATVALKVVNGIEDIDASAQTYVLKDARKNVTFKVAVDLNDSSNNTGKNLSFNKKYAPKNKKVGYEIVPTGSTIAGVTVDDKGTVKVAPNAKVGESFYVCVKSKDGTNAYGYTNPITITDAKQSMGDLVILGRDNKGKYTIVADANDTKLEVTKSGWTGYYVAALRPGVEKKSFSYSDLSDSDIVVESTALNITPAKGGIYADPTDGQIYVNKLGKVTFKAVDKTDKKNSKSLKVEFVETAPKKVLQITQFAGSNYGRNAEKYAERYEEDFSFSGSNTTYFGMNLVTRGAEEENDTVVNLSDTKISFKKNTKNVTPKYSTGYQYIIAVTGDKAEIQLTSKKNGNTKYTFTNTAFQSKKAPKVALNPKKQPAIQYWETTLTYQLSATTKGDSFEDKYVMLSVDSTKKNPDDANGAFYVNRKNYIDRAIPVRDGNLFDLVIKPDYAGSYNLNVAVGYLSNGTFVPEYADAKLAVKVTKQNTNLKVTGKYSLDPRFATKVKIAYNEKDGSAQFANNGFVQKDGKRNYAMNAISENKENRFNEFFIAETNEWGDIGTIGLRDNLTPEQLKEIMGESGKAHLNGFISVEKPGCKRMDVPVTMSFKAVAAKNLKAVSTSVLSGDNMVTTIQVLNGKERVPVKAAYEVLETTAFAKDGTQQENWLTNQVWSQDENGKDILLGGDIRLKGSSSAVVGKNKFKVKVTPLYAAAGADPVELNVEVTVAKADTTNKVVLAKGKNKWTVTHDDYVGPTGAADEPAAGAWVTSIPYTFKSALGVAEDTKINVEPDSNVSYVFFSSETDKYSESDVSGGKELIVSIDKEKLMELVEAKKVKLGKKVTVKPTFSYGDEEHKTTLVKDTVSITITLPKTLKESVTEADFKEIEPTVQNMVKTMTAYNKKNSYDAEGSNWDIKCEIEKRFRAVAASATAAVTVTHDGSENKFATKYDVVVANGATKIYEHSFTESALNGASFVATKIEELGENQWAKVTADPEVKDLFTLTKDSSYEEYLAMIKNILTKKGYLTENIGLTIKPYNEGRKQPSTTQDGQINARVSVKDKTVVNQTSTYADVDYVLYKIETAADAESRLTDYLAKEETIKKIVAEAWTKAVAGQPEDEDELKEALTAAVQEIIVKKANDELKENVTDTEDSNKNTTANANLSVEMQKDSLKVTMNVTGDGLTELNYTLVLKDSTPKAKDKKVPVDCDTTVGSLTIDELQTEQTMLDGLTAADLTIPGTDTMTAEDAAAAVRTEILNAKKNPTFVEDNLKVDVKKDGETALFVKPNGKTDGLVSVTATYGDNKATKDYDNIVILASGNSIDLSDAEKKEIEDAIDADANISEEDKEQAKVDAIAEAKVVKRIEAKIRTHLSPANLEAEVKDLAGKAFDNDAIIEKIKALAENAIQSEGKIGGEGSNKDEYKYNLSESDPAAVVFATDDKDAALQVKAPTAKTEGSIPAFTVNFAKNEAGAKNNEVKFDAVTIKEMAGYQTLEEAEADVKAQLTSGALTIGFVDIKTKTEGDGITLDTSEAKKLTDAVAKFLQDKAITADGIEVTVATIDAEGQNPGTTYTKPEDTTLVANNLKATITQSSDEKTVTITTVTVKTEANTSAVKSVKITKVGEKTIAYDENSGDITDEAGNGNSDTNAILVENVQGKDQKVHVEVAVEKFSTASEDVTIKVEGASNTDVTEGVTCVKAVSGTGYDLLIPDDAAGADNTNRKLALKLTATANDKSVTGADVLSTPIYVTLQFVPTVETITITGPDDIEVNGKEGQEASEEITYTATMTGLHLHADDKATLTNEAEKKDGITVEADDSVTGKNKSGVTVKVDYSKLSEGEEGAATIKLQAATDLNAATGVSPKTKDIAIRNNAASKAAITLGEVTGVDVKDLETEVEEGKTHKKYIVSGEVGEVTIPLSITGDAITDRNWTFGEDAVTVTKDDKPDEETKKAITVRYDKKSKSLTITDGIKQIKDEEHDEDGKLKDYTPTLITLKATAAADAEKGLAAIETSYKFALVVNSSVTGIAIQDGRDGADDDGEGMIDVQWEADQDDSNKQTVTLKPVFEGNHFIESEETKNVTFKFSSAGKTKGVAGAKITKAGVLTIPSTATNGYIEVEAVYGTSDDAPRATRKIHFTKQ